MRKKGKIHMSETVKSLANMYGLTLDEALAALEANNILILSTDLQLDQVKTLKYSKIFADIKSTPKPKPTPRPAPETNGLHREQKILNSIPRQTEHNILDIISNQKLLKVFPELEAVQAVAHLIRMRMSVRNSF